MKNLVFLFICFAFVSCGTTKVSNVNLSGIWTEEWFNSDVDYVDTIRISQTGKTFNFACLNQQNYIYAKDIKQQKDSLKFKMENEKGSNFFVHYKIKIINNTLLQGTVTSTGNPAETKVLFTKIE